jgi:hypothetical protein
MTAAARLPLPAPCSPRRARFTRGPRHELTRLRVLVCSDRRSLHRSLHHRSLHQSTIGRCTIGRSSSIGHSSHDRRSFTRALCRRSRYCYTTAACATTALALPTLVITTLALPMLTLPPLALIQPLLLALYNTLHKLPLAILSRALPFALPLRALVYRHSVVNRPVQ